MKNLKVISMPKIYIVNKLNDDITYPTKAFKSKQAAEEFCNENYTQHDSYTWYDAKDDCCYVAITTLDLIE
jgi:hypothetical protein